MYVLGLNVHHKIPNGISHNSFMLAVSMGALYMLAAFECVHALLADDELIAQETIAV